MTAMSSHHHKNDDWLLEAQSSQRNIVFPDTVRNEARFWRNLREWNTTTKIGLLILGIFVYGLAATLVIALVRENDWRHLSGLVLGMILLWGPAFALLAWATRRALMSARRRNRTH
jgi:hypothetical protein